MQTATPEEVNRAVALDLRSRRISQKNAGDIIGKSRTQVSNQLCSNRRFSKSMAELFSRAFGYNVQYLLYGEGELKMDEAIHDGLSSFSPERSDLDTVSVLSALISIAEDIIYRTGNEEAFEAWRAISEGDFNGYIENMKRITGRDNVRRGNAILARYVASKIDNRNFMVVARETTE